MEFLRYFLIFLHIVGTAAVVGGWFAFFKKPTVLPAQLWGALTQLVTGLALAGLADANHQPLNYVKIGLKLLITVAVVVPAVIGYRRAQRGEKVPTGLAHAVGGGALINAALAVLWQ